MHSRSAQRLTPPDGNLNLCLTCCLPFYPPLFLLFFPQETWFTCVRDKDICLLASATDVDIAIPSSLLSPFLICLLLPLLLLLPYSNWGHQPSSCMLVNHQWDSRHAGRRDVTHPGYFRPPSQITRVTRHCLLSTVTSLCRTKSGIKKQKERWNMNEGHSG